MEWKHEDGKICTRDEKGNIIAEACYYEKSNGDINIDHVFVNSDYRGQGLAEEAMVKMTEHLRKEGIKTSATCPYAKSWLSKNREVCKDIISESHKL